MASGKSAKSAEKPKPAEVAEVVVEQTAAPVTEAEAQVLAPAAVEGAEVGSDGIPILADAGAAAPADAGQAEPAGSQAPDEAGPGNPASQPAEPEPIAEGDVTVIVATAIGGTRNGVPWPAVGQPITLPAAEAAGYLQFGYVREDESAE